MAVVMAAVMAAVMAVVMVVVMAAVMVVVMAAVMAAVRMIQTLILTVLLPLARLRQYALQYQRVIVIHLSHCQTHHTCHGHMTSAISVFLSVILRVRDRGKITSISIFACTTCMSNTIQLRWPWRLVS